MVETKRRLDTYNSEDMAIPIFKLVQNVGSQYAKSLGAQPGDFFCPLTEEIAKELEIVVVDVGTQRTYWGRNEIEDSPPDCASLDSKSMTSMDGKDCHTCQYRCDAPWALKPTERRQMCNLSYNILGINTADGMPILVRAGGISALPARQLITLLRLNKNLKGEYHRVLVVVSSAKKKTTAGEAFTMHFKVKGLVTDEARANELKNQSFQLLGMPIALPEGRSEEEEPVAFNPEGKPIYSVEEAEKAKRHCQEKGSTTEKPAKEEMDLNF